MVYAATGTKNYATVVELIVQELKEITSNKVDARELEKAKNQLKGGLMLSLESSGSRMVQLAKEEMYFKKHFTLDEMIKNIDAVTANGIKSLANRLFYSKSFTLALLGPIRNNKVLKDILHN
jgi:predicted Zn-dependent peptidase